MHNMIYETIFVTALILSMVVGAWFGVSVVEFLDARGL